MNYKSWSKQDENALYFDLYSKLIYNERELRNGVYSKGKWSFTLNFSALIMKGGNGRAAI